jgi:hypothetical protein
MADFTPHNNLFKKINTLTKISNFLFWVIFLLTILQLPVKSFYDITEYIDLMNIINIISICFLFTLDIIIEFVLIPLANNKRIDDFLDNSLGSNFSQKNSINYYDNDKIKIGLYKVAVNLFENCYFTKSLLCKSYIDKIIIPILFIIVLIISTYAGFKNNPFGLTILQTLLSINILGNLIKYLILVIKLNTIEDNLNSLFQNINFKTNLMEYEIYIYRYWLKYETLISKINPDISTKTFAKSNTILTKEWEDIKIKHNIF